MNYNLVILLGIGILAAIYFIIKTDKEAKRKYTLEEVMELGKTGSLQNGTPVFKVFVKEHENGKQKVINENLKPGFLMHDKETQVEYKIKNEIFDLPSEVKK